MPLNDIERAQVQATVGAMVERQQPPPEIQDQLRIEMEIDGHRVRVWTVRPQYMNPTETVRSAVAQFTYVRTRDAWTLHWMRADGKWHRWRPEESTGPLADLVRIVEEDRAGAFWG